MKQFTSRDISTLYTSFWFCGKERERERDSWNALYACATTPCFFSPETRHRPHLSDDASWPAASGVLLRVLQSRSNSSSQDRPASLQPSRTTTKSDSL